MLLNIFHSGGLQWVLIILSLAVVYLWYLCYKQSKSGSLVGGSSDDPVIRDGGGDLPIYKVPFFPWAVGLTIAVIAMWIGIGVSYQGI